MTRTLVISCLVIAGASAAGARGIASRQDAEANVRQTVLDYFTGWLTGDTAILAMRVHPSFHRVSAGPVPRVGGRDVLTYVTASLLAATARMTPSPATDLARPSVQVFEVAGDLAAAALTSPAGTEYVHVVRSRGQWLVEAALKSGRPAGALPARAFDRTAVERAARDYIEGAYSADAERVVRALHPEVHKVRVAGDPRSGEAILMRTGWSLMVEGTRMGAGQLPEEDRDIAIHVFDIADGLAAVRILSRQYRDYLQMAVIDGEWKVINVLWVPNPDAS